MNSVIRLLYNLLTFAGALLLLPVFLATPRGRVNIGHRYGLWRLSGNYTWFHGASLGEINGLLPIITRYRKMYPEERILLTATSPTGLERGAELVNEVRLIPVDNWLFVWLAARKITTRTFIFGETELWPELLKFFRSRGVPCILVNGRISDTAYPYYLTLKFLWSDLLRGLSSVLCSSHLDMKRFIALGASESNTKVIGNSKYEVSPSIQDITDAKSLQARLGFAELPVLTLGSLRPGEEEDWFPCLAERQQRGDSYGCIIAPRHSEKYEYFAEKLTSYGIKFSRYTQLYLEAGSSTVHTASVLLLDTMGMLEKIYSCSTAGFIGGTLRNYGGHNPLEPAMYGCAPILGPFHQNAQSVVDELIQGNGALIIKSPVEAAEVLNRVISRDPGLAVIGQNSKLVWKSLSGATDRYIQEISMVLSSAQRGSHDS